MREVVDVTSNAVSQRIELWCELDIYVKDGISEKKETFYKDTYAKLGKKK